MATQEQKTVAFVLYPGLTLLDLVGPLQVFASLRRFNDQYRPVVAERTKPMSTDGPLTVTADQTFDDVPDPAVVIVPGGDAPTIKAMGNQAVLDYLRRTAETAPVVGSVCTGSLVLAAADLLKGRNATTHWAYHRLLERLGATYLPQRWVEDGKFITSAGVSAGIDMALALVARLTDEAIEAAAVRHPDRRPHEPAHGLHRVEAAPRPGTGAGYPAPRRQAHSGHRPAAARRSGTRCHGTHGLVAQQHGRAVPAHHRDRPE